MSASAPSARICVGQFAGAHGVRGLVRLKPFTAAAEDVVRYGPVETEDAARRFAFEIVGHAKGALIVRVDGVSERDAAAALAGTRLYVARERLPAPAPDEYYHADLIGLAVAAPDGTTLGTIRAVHDFGAGDLVELELVDGRAVMVPFTRAVVTEIDLARGRAVAVLPADALDDTAKAEDAA
ncbi:MAG: 16S rRNA processing protein RimM [Proteobacteria bacterium]|nr:16S rRNA processing protein RimM [Pseudomonadota bacterium]